MIIGGAYRKGIFAYRENEMDNIKNIIALLPIRIELRKWRIFEPRSWFGCDKWEVGKIKSVRVSAVFIFLGSFIIRFGLP